MRLGDPARSHDGHPGHPQDPVAADNPLVAGEMGVRFYAAAPIITPDGHKLGTVNVLDTRPRSITEEDTAALADLAAIVLDETELRLSALRALRDEQARREAERHHAEAERARAEAERAARKKAEQDKAAIAAFASTLQRTLLPPGPSRGAGPGTGLPLPHRLRPRCRRRLLRRLPPRRRPAGVLPW
ncbi:GAF domain-containing protein [Streptomyces longwoodensis]|uniref:GAF domain-containing protein n=1 Tax=Streptomyces longwoodensis TaxID=68231 RepID=UPI0033DDABE6